MTLNQYWLKYYVDYDTNLCSLCANTGIINTEGIKSPAGMPTGRKNFCICPNGRAMRRAKSK
jgi:hypothetical protein